MTFQQHNVWDLSFLEPDYRTVAGRHSDVPSNQELFELAERGGADVSEIRQSIARWNKGSPWLSTPQGGQLIQLLMATLPKKSGYAG